MMNRTSITLDAANLSYLDMVSGKNRSQYINELIAADKKRTLAKRIMLANAEEAEYLSLQEDMSAWDTTLQDGLE